MERDGLIERLVTYGHLNVPERKFLGSVSRAEVFAAVRTRLERDGRFPPNAGIGNCIREGSRIRRSDSGRYVGINQRASPEWHVNFCKSFDINRQAMLSLEPQKRLAFCEDSADIAFLGRSEWRHSEG